MPAPRPIPADSQVLTPFVAVDDVAEFVSFLAEAFGGKAAQASRSADGVVRYARVLLGDSQLMATDTTDVFAPMPCMLHLYTENVDATFKHALQAGATPVREPTDQRYGDRLAGVEDPWGTNGGSRRTSRT